MLTIGRIGDRPASRHGKRRGESFPAGPARNSQKAAKSSFKNIKPFVFRLRSFAPLENMWRNNHQSPARGIERKGEVLWLPDRAGAPSVA